MRLITITLSLILGALLAYTTLKTAQAIAKQEAQSETSKLRIEITQ